MRQWSARSGVYWNLVHLLELLFSFVQLLGRLLGSGLEQGQFVQSAEQLLRHPSTGIFADVLSHVVFTAALTETTREITSSARGPSR